MTSHTSRTERESTILNRVRRILEKYPATRNDDTYLWLMYVREYEPDLSKYISFIPYELIKKAVKHESLSRARRYIQNEMGLYPPTEKTRRRRRMAEYEYRKKYGGGLA